MRTKLHHLLEQNRSCHDRQEHRDILTRNREFGSTTLLADRQYVVTGNYEHNQSPRPFCLLQKPRQPMASIGPQQQGVPKSSLIGLPVSRQQLEC